MEKKKQRLNWIDMCRGLIMIIVVMGHTLTTDSNLRFIIFTFHMPALFVISGYVFKSRKFVESTPKYAKRLLVPLYGAGAALLVYRLIYINIIGGTLDDIIYWVKRTIVAVLFASGIDTPKGFPEVHTFGMLWFLAAMFWAMIIFSLIFYIIRKESVRAIVCVVLTIVGMIISNYVWLPMNIDISLIVLVYLYVGHSLKRIDMDSKKKMIPLLVLCVIVWTINYLLKGRVELALRKFDIVGLSYVASIAGSIVVIYLSKIIYTDKKIFKPLCFIGRNSMTFLILHFMESNFIPWNIIYPGNVTYKKHIIILFLLKLMVIVMTLYIWVKIKAFIKNERVMQINRKENS